jgi:hypothetical protein
MNAQSKLKLKRQRKCSFESSPAHHGHGIVPGRHARVAQLAEAEQNLKPQAITAISGRKDAHRSIQRPEPRVAECGCKSRLPLQADRSRTYRFGEGVVQSQDTAQSRVSSGLKRSRGRVVNRVEHSGFERRTQIAGGQGSLPAVANLLRPIRRSMPPWLVRLEVA